jgi:hypothetical protein
MDTDSAYMALAGDDFDSLVKPEMREEYERDKYNWFLRMDTKEHYAFDKRVPGLFKPECVGKGIWALASKSYKVLLFDGEEKMSCKGIQQDNNMDVLGYDIYGQVCMENIRHTVENKGFRILNNKQVSNEYDIASQEYINSNKDEFQKDRSIYTYSIMKTGLSNKYTKRVVLSDGVSTIPLSI